MVVKNHLLLHEVAELLGYRSKRSVLKWCNNNRVAVLSFPKARKKFILKSEFEAVILALTTAHLRSRYGEVHLDNALKAHRCGDIISILKLNEQALINPPSVQAQDVASLFLSEIKSALQNARSK